MQEMYMQVYSWATPWTVGCIDRYKFSPARNKFKVKYNITINISTKDIWSQREDNFFMDCTESSYIKHTYKTVKGITFIKNASSQHIN